MKVNVLGPLEATESGCSLVPTAHKPRQVLALLALNAGRVVTVSSLMEELWGAAPPRSAATTLQTYIMQLRRGLGAAAAAAAAGGGTARAPKDLLATRTCGYVLDIAPEQVDVHAYELALAAGRAAAGRGDDLAAADHLASALALWRGPALADVQSGLLLEIETVRLHESRVCALESRIEADLRLGRHHELISELTVLSARHPLNENIAASALIALYRSGRQSGALETYARLRRTLVQELGVEPSGRLQRLYSGILNADPALDVPTTSRSSSPAPELPRREAA